ncbi:MAG: CRTAC1 family protein [Haloarculaceae archaeon]
MTPTLSRRFWYVFAAVVVIVSASVGAALALGGGQAVAGQDHVRFEETSRECGLTYRTSGDATGSDDGAVAVADYDRDGWPDLVTAGGGPVLFHNTGSGFDRSGALPDGDYPELKSVLFLDANGNGWQDLLLVPRQGTPILLANDRGTFHRVPGAFNRSLQWGTGASAADFNGDGRVDVYVTQNGDWRDQTPRRGASGEATDGYPNILFENTGDGFEAVDGAAASTHWSLATSFVDLTGDGRPDIHVANDYGYDQLYVNRGNGSFDVRRINGTNRHGMASVVRDVNGDGHLDLFVTNIEFPDPSNVWELNSGLNVRNRGNTLLLNRGNGTFSEVGQERGVRQGGWGWSAAIEDFDNDGTLDLIHATKAYLQRAADGGFEGVHTRPALWEARPNGTFERRNASEAGLLTSNGRGLATLDYDRDGRRDVVVADTSGRFRLYHSVAGNGNWLEVRVRGHGALGARVTVETSRGTRLRVESSRSGLFSQSSRALHFGLGPATVDRVRIVRADGTEQVLRNVTANHRLAVAGNGSVRRADVEAGGC